MECSCTASWMVLLRRYSSTGTEVRHLSFGIGASKGEFHSLKLCPIGALFSVLSLVHWGEVEVLLMGFLESVASQRQRQPRHHLVFSLGAEPEGLRRVKATACAMGPRCSWTIS